MTSKHQHSAPTQSMYKYPPGGQGCAQSEVTFESQLRPQRPFRVAHVARSTAQEDQARNALT